MRFHEGLTVPRRMLLVPGALDLDATAGDGGLAGLQIRWFDYFLRGAENGVLDEPPVRYFLTGARQWTDQAEWPADAEPTPLFLTAPGGGAGSPGDGGLAWEPPAGAARCCSRTTLPPPAGHRATPATSGRSDPARSRSRRPRWSVT